MKNGNCIKRAGIKDMKILNNNFSILSTDDVITVASKAVSVGKISLKAHYGTSGNNHTGKITYVTPYPEFTLLIDRLIKLASKPINLGRVCYLAR